MVNNAIDTRLRQLQKNGKTGLMTHVVVGYPTLSATVELVKTMANHGVDFVELQLPFSDPLADGITIQRACETSLAAGTKVSDAFAAAKQLTSQVEIPLLFMAYFNTVHSYGIDRFCKDAQAAGISGLIVPDVPLEAAEHEGFLQACKKYNLHNIITLAPTSSVQRIKKNAKIASGFAYCMTQAGTTGTQVVLTAGVAEYFATIKKYMPVPIAAGFGIKSNKDVKAIAPHADVVVVGSALINVIDANRDDPAMGVASFLNDLLS